MKKVTLLAWTFLALTACSDRKSNSRNNPEGQDPEQRPQIGGDRDRNGCLTAAGETWSGIKQDCIQIFNVGQRLNPIEKNEVEAVISAFVLFNDDRSKLELFLPDQKKTILLHRDGKGSYQRDSWKFDPEDSTLYIDGKKRYKTE